MHIGINKKRDEQHRLDAAKNYRVDNLDLINLSLTVSRDSSHARIKERASRTGDQCYSLNQSRFSLRKVGLGEPSCHRLPKEKPLDDFLLPPRRRNSLESLTCKSACPLSKSRNTETTPDGSFQIKSQQVLFESQRVSVVLSKNSHTATCSTLDMKKMNYGSGEFSKNSAMDAILSQAGIPGLGSIIGDTPVRSDPKVSSEYESKQTSEILDPELNLSRLGYTGNDPIDWSKVALPDKKDLYLELCRRITHKKNADCKVHIGKEEFSCHLIVLQCYSELFDGYIAIKKVEIPSDKCSATSFSFIYDWMVSEEQSYKYLNRENVLDIFNSAKYLKIKDLVEQCWAFVDNVDVFNEDTAFLLYVDAKIKNVEEVRELMVPRIQEFFLILVSSQDWLELDVDDVKNLLSSNYIRINCEMEVFMSAVRWLKFDWTTRDKFKYEVLNCVRFGNIAPWQLVDIKRNPENPEFMELAKDPAICKLIDDGLAYVIIKYWYGNENDDFQHWNAVLGLQEPHGRNWSGLDKTYFTFREFLIYLDQYRRNQLIEKSKPKASLEKKLGAASATAMSPNEPVPSMEDFLSKKKGSAIVNFASSTKLGTLMEEEDLGFEDDEDFERFSQDSEEEKFYNALKMFTPSKNKVALLKLNRLSSSVVSPNKEKQYFLHSSLFLPEHETILVFGGINPYIPYGLDGNTGKEIFRYLPDSNSWESVGSLPEPRHYHSVGFLKGRVYLAGGADPRDDELKGNSFVVNTVWSFEPVRRRWFSEPCMKESRKNFGLVVCKKKMYVIGGFTNDLECLASVECYRPKKGSWKVLSPMKTPRAGFACAKYRDFIWVAGGAGDSQNPILDVVESYDLKNNQWTTITSLNSPRCFSGFFAMSDRLFMIGGAGCRYAKSDISCSVDSVEIWNSFNCCWEEIANLTIPRHGHALAYISSQIFVLGGITTNYLRCLNDVECFCTNRDTWVRGVACLPYCLSGHAAVTLPPALLMTNR